MQVEPVAWASVKRMPSRAKPVATRRLDDLRAVTAEVAVADVVGKYEDDVGFGRPLRHFGSAQRRQRHQQQGSGKRYEGVS